MRVCIGKEERLAQHATLRLKKEVKEGLGHELIRHAFGTGSFRFYIVKSRYVPGVMDEGATDTDKRQGTLAEFGFFSHRFLNLPMF